MFESAFALDTPARRSPLLISLAIQTATLATLVILPLYYIEQLTAMPAMPVPVYVPKLPHMKILSVVREAASAMMPRLTDLVVRPLQAPARIVPLNQSEGRRVISEDGMPAIDPGTVGIPIDGALTRADRILPKVAPPENEPVEKPMAKPGPMRVGGDVQSAKLIYQVKPIYPPLAKQARIQGTVRLQAIIARDGNIQNLVLASGHPLLVPAAMDAVRQWRYRPTTLNGEAVEVMTQIDLNFTLSQ